jgi:prephenate dehydrogenase
MWRDVLMANRQELLAQSKLFQKAMMNLEQMIVRDEVESLEAEIDKASLTRAQWRMTVRK